MKKVIGPVLLLGIVFWCSYCTSMEKEDMLAAKAKSEIRSVIEGIENDAETANIEGLKSSPLLSTKFTKFGPRNFDRQDVQATNDSESAFFGSISNYLLEVRDLKIDIFGDVGIATYYPYVSFVQDGEEKIGSGRQTLVFQNTKEGWKIVHEHGTPRDE